MFTELTQALESQIVDKNQLIMNEIKSASLRMERLEDLVTTPSKLTKNNSINSQNTMTP